MGKGRTGDPERFSRPAGATDIALCLRRKGRLVKFLARGLTDYRVPSEEREALDRGRMLVLTACPPEVRRTTRVTALARNRLVLTLATETVIPYVAAGSPLTALVAEQGVERKA